jgi:pectate lyase
VLANAGATIGLDGRGDSYWRRDLVDERIVNDVRSGTGSYIDDPSEVGGWPELAAGTAPADSDHDGMPDEWEHLYCLSPADSADGPQDADGDGYTNVEEYLNGTEPSDICANGQP